MKKTFFVVTALLLGLLMNAQCPTYTQYAYIANNGNNTVSAVNLSTNLVAATIAVGKKPYGVSVSRDGTRGYVTNSGSNTVSIINTITNTVISTINVGLSPQGICVSPDGTSVYVTNYNDNTLSIINSYTNTVITTLYGFSNPYGISIAPDGTKLYVVNSGGSVSVINTSTNSIIASILVDGGPTGICVSPDGTMAYVTTYSGTKVTVINTSNNTVKTTFVAGVNSEYGVCFNLDGTKAYIANTVGNSVSIINTVTNTLIATVLVGGPYGVCVSPDGSKVYVVNHSNSTLGVISTTTNTLISTITSTSFWTPFNMGNFIASVPIPCPLFSISSFYPTIASIGMIETIKGTGFTGATAVSFGGTPASSFTVVNDSIITAEVGSGASGNVVIVAPNGKDSLSGFTYSTLPTKGLVAWYPFTGNTIDSSGNGNNGTNYGATLTKDRFGNANSAYSFDGASYIYTNNNLCNFRTNDFTIAAWYFGQIGSNYGEYILSKRDVSSFGNFFTLSKHPGFEIDQSSNNDYNFIDSNLGNIGLGAWKQVVVTRKGNLFKVYLGGEVLYSVHLSMIHDIANSAKFYIGGVDPSVNLNNPSFHGLIDDIRIYNRALDSTEVRALYHEGGFALPVSIVNINATDKGNLVTVNWQTATELNTSHFIIQHSTDGSSFTDIGTVIEIGSGANNYSFTDNNPARGTNYYRLKSVDKDGSSSFSKVVSLQLSINNYQMSVVPNPTRDITTIKGSHIASIEVIDNIGKLVKVILFKDATNPILSVSALPAGVYHLSIHSTNGNVTRVGFIKE